MSDGETRRETGAGSHAGRIQPLLAGYLAPALLVLVACSQIYLAHVRELLSPARGGGFGLFSTVDKLGHRQLRMFVSGPSGSAKVALPARPVIAKRIRNTASLPTEASLRTVAELMEELGRTVEVEGEPPFPLARVEVWKRAFDQDSLRASRELVAELVVQRRR